MTQGQLERVAITRANDGPVILVPRRCEFTRIIVSLTRNNSLWLTSLGWRAEEKSIALNCDNTADGLAIRIPKKYAAEIEAGDDVMIACQELGFYGNLSWDAAAAPAGGTSAIAGSPSPETDFSAPIGSTLGSKKGLILGGVAALALLGVIGTFALGGDKTQTNAATKAPLMADADGAPLREVENAADSRAAKIEAARAIAAEIEAKKDEADRLAAQKIQDEEAAIAAKKQATLDAAKKAKADKDAAAKKKREDAKAKKEAEARAKAEEAQAKKEAIAQEKADKLAALEAEKKAEAQAQAQSRSEANLSNRDIRSLQDDLAYMGYYTGPVDGTLSEATISSVKFFKSIFEIPETNPIDREFLEEVARQRDAYVKDILPYEGGRPSSAPAPVQQQAPAPIQTAPPATVASLPVKPITQSAAPIVAAEPAPVPAPQTAVLTPPKLIKRDAPEYPSRPYRRKDFSENVTVVITFGIDTSGDPINVSVQSNSHDGTFTDSFNKAALEVAEKQKFVPAMQGNTPVTVGNQRLTLVFKK